MVKTPVSRIYKCVHVVIEGVVPDISTDLSSGIRSEIHIHEPVTGMVPERFTTAYSAGFHGAGKQTGEVHMSGYVDIISSSSSSSILLP